MTQVDFYIIGDQSGQTRQRLVCTLAGKAVARGQRVFIQAADETQAGQLDDLLWTFRDISFLPHARCGDGQGDAPVLIGTSDTPDGNDDVMINLAHPAPNTFSRFQRVLEIVDPDPTLREQARERYRFYQDRGYPLQRHEL